MATDDQQILVVGQAPAPASWKVPGNGQVQPKAVFAHYDGTGAGGAFKPALKIISDAGQTVGIYAGDTQIAAGASADVSWFPRLKGAASSAGSGIQFDTDPQTGTWLHTLVTGNGGDQNNGYEFFSTGGPFAVRALGNNVGNNTGDVDIIGSEDFNVTQGRDVNIATGTSPRYPGTGGNVNISSAVDLAVHATGEADFTADGEVDIVSARAGGTGDIFINVHSGGTGNIRMITLPNADPGVSGALWNNGGVVNISP